MGSLTLRGNKWVARWVVNGKIHVRSTKTDDKALAEERLKEYTAPTRLGSEAEALEVLAVKIGRRKAEVAKFEDSKPAIEIVSGWQEYLDQHNRPDSGEATLRQYEFQYEAFAKWFLDNHPKTSSDGGGIRCELRHVTQDEADRYAGYLLKKVSASTFNRHMNLLALVWRVLKKKARLTENPWESIERKRFKVRSRRELTVDELGRVIAAAQGEMKLLLAIGIYCGLRLGDAASLDWGSVDVAKGIISLVPMKTARRSQKRVTIPIHSTLHAMLNVIPKEQRVGPVMPNLKARWESFNGALARDVESLFLSVDIKTNVNALTASEKAAMEQAKKDGKELPALKRATGRASADCGYHSLRHTFVSLCAAGGVPQSVVQSLVGHGSPAMTQHYTHIGIETAKNAVDLLPDVTKEPAKANTETEPTPDAPAQVDRTALLATLEGMTAKTWKADRDKLVLALTRSMPHGTVG